VRARAVGSAEDAILLVDGKRAEKAPVIGRSVSFALANTRPGRHVLQVRFRRAGRIVESTAPTPAWLLPASAAFPIHSGRVDAELSRALTRLGSRFSGYAAFAVEDAGRQRGARWNADARFPAASTVKLGVLVAAIARFGRGEVVRYDLEQVAHWSSNLAANRLVRLLGSGSVERGSTIVERTLRTLGARRSTYTGMYRVGTAHAASGGDPPLVSFRVTTAADMATVMATIHSAAAGDRRALRRSGLGIGEARLALGLLLGSQTTGENAGLVRPFVTAAVPIARKEGWLSGAHHTVAVAYPNRGPIVVSVLTYRAGLSLAQAQRLGRALVLALDL
jgi:beta-lactamase class A